VLNQKYQKTTKSRLAFINKGKYSAKIGALFFVKRYKPTYYKHFYLR